MNETQLKISVMKYLKDKGAFVYKCSDRFTSGMPDIYVCYQGRSIWLELKTLIGIVSPIQHYTIQSIKKSGGEAYVCRTLDQVKEII